MNVQLSSMENLKLRFFSVLERRRSREEENLIQVDYRGSSSSPDTLSAIFPTIPFFSARSLAGNLKTRRH